MKHDWSDWIFIKTFSVKAWIGQHFKKVRILNFGLLFRLRPLYLFILIAFYCWYIIKAIHKKIGTLIVITFFNYSYRQHAIGVSNPVVDAAPLNMAPTNRNMTDVEDSPETLQNIMRVTRDQESVFKVALIWMKLSLDI